MKEPLNLTDVESITNKGKESKLTNYEKLLRGREILRENVRKSITFSKPIVRLNDDPLFYQRTINVIQGKTGTHKSRLAEYICSAMLKKSDCNTDLLGLKLGDVKNPYVLYVDTERNLSDQFPYSIQQIIKNAGYQITDDIPNFDYISLIDIERSERFTAFREYLERKRKEFDSNSEESNKEFHFFVILDVITDLIDNFNDPKPSLQLIDLLNSAINNFDITFLCIIHENPFQEKARGHLGTELLNKSSTALSINYEKDKNGNDQDIIKIQYLKIRYNKKNEPFFVKYSQEKQGLIFADKNDIEKAIHSKEKKGNIYDVADFLIDNLKIEISRKDLIDMLSDRFDISKRTADDRIKDLLKGEGFSGSGYKLESVKKGKENYYRLIKLQENENLF